jgi:hypothetical protein
MSTGFRLRMRSKAPRGRCVDVFAAVLLATCTVLVGARPALAGSPLTVAISTQTTFVDGVGVGSKSQFFDTATLSGAPSGLPTPTGTVTFNVYGPITYPFVYGPGSCAGTPTYTSTNPLNTAGTSATSNTFVPPDGEEKKYLFTASYSGDAVYAPVTSECDAPGESVTVPIVTFAVAEPVVAPPVAPPVQISSPVSISKFTFSPAAFTIGRDPSTHSKTKAKRSMRRFERGTTISYVLSGTGTVTIAINKFVTGLRMAGRGCVPAAAASRKALLAGMRRGRRSALLHHTDCQASQKVGALVFSSQTRVNSYAFNGRLGSWVLTAGSYQADASVNTAASPPSTVSAVFKIVPAAQ